MTSETSPRRGAAAGDARLAGLHSALAGVLGTAAWRLCDDRGAAVGESAASAFTMTLRSRRALDRLLGALPDRGFGRAYVAGDLEVEPLDTFLAAMADLSTAAVVRRWPRVALALVAAGARPRRQPVSAAEARLRGSRHSPGRDRAAVEHHYDLPVDFYALWLDSSLAYSCAYWGDGVTSLDEAQARKHELVCRKLRLRTGERLLDVGCGYGGLVLHAARHHGVRALGITNSPAQAAHARRRVAEAGLSDRVEVRQADYRDDLGGPYDAVASVGMVEHVGHRLHGRFAAALHGALRPGGRLLLHGITVPPTVSLSRGSFVDAFVFPDGELPELGALATALQAAGLELRDVESLREHYALTLDAWRGRLEARWEDAVRLAGAERARVWRLYMAGSALAFRRARVGIHQLLAVRPDGSGGSGLPLTREDWFTAPLDGVAG